MAALFSSESRNRPTVLVACHDAGGANLILSWCCRAKNRFEFSFYLKGPALTLLHSNYPELSNDSLVDEFLQRDFYLTGSGWQSDVETTAIMYAKEHLIPVACFIDHWANYDARFQIGKKKSVYPDEIWTADWFAFQLAEQIFLNQVATIRYVGNFYQKRVSKVIAELEQQLVSGNGSEINAWLILGEPIRGGTVNSVNLYIWFAEFLIKKLEKVNRYLGDSLPNPPKVIFRPHPSGITDSEQLFLDALSKVTSVEKSTVPLEHDIARSSNVYGYQSAVMPIALAAKKDVYSFFPTKELDKILPHQDIVYVNE